MKSLLVSAAVFLSLCASLLFLGFMYLTEQTASAAAAELESRGRLSLYKFGLIDSLSPGEIARLYQETCTRKCHGRDVIEKSARTASEWESVVARMRASDRADIGDRYALAISRYLQSRFLSNVPTVLPEKTMKFVKRYLWRSDFGESDLFLDIIYIPREQIRLLPYLGVREPPADSQAALFVVYINTHQGSVPPWNLAAMATLRHGAGRPTPASRWEVLYQDGQRHHNQGVLSFPHIDTGEARELEIEMHLPGLGKRIFQWSSAIPASPD